MFTMAEQLQEWLDQKYKCEEILEEVASAASLGDGASELDTSWDEPDPDMYSFYSGDLGKGLEECDLFEEYEYTDKKGKVHTAYRGDAHLEAKTQNFQTIFESGKTRKALDEALFTMYLKMLTETGSIEPQFTCEEYYGAKAAVTRYFEACTWGKYGKHPHPDQELDAWHEASERLKDRIIPAVKERAIKVWEEGTDVHHSYYTTAIVAKEVGIEHASYMGEDGEWVDPASLDADETYEVAKIEAAADKAINRPVHYEVGELYFNYIVFCLAFNKIPQEKVFGRKFQKYWEFHSYLLGDFGKSNGFLQAPFFTAEQRRELLALTHNVKRLCKDKLYFRWAKDNAREYKMSPMVARVVLHSKGYLTERIEKGCKKHDE